MHEFLENRDRSAYNLLAGINLKVKNSSNTELFDNLCVSYDAIQLTLKVRRNNARIASTENIKTYTHKKKQKKLKLRR